MCYYSVNGVDITFLGNIATNLQIILIYAILNPKY